jgi:hypothetical protein
MLAIVKPRAARVCLLPTTGPARLHYSAAAWGWIRTSHVQSVHLSCRVASTGRGTGRDVAIDFHKILGREHNVRGAHILLKVLARFRAGYRYDEDARTLSPDHWPRDGELGERGVLPAHNGLEAQSAARGSFQD